MGKIIWMLGFSSWASWRNCCTARCWSIWYRLFIATLSFFLGRKNHPRSIMTADVRVATFYELTGILESCHPSDNLGAILAAGEYIGATGRDLMTALAVAYQVQCRLCDVAPVRARGFDHTVQGAYGVAAGVSRILKLDPSQTANAIAISGTAFNALRVTRTGKLSHWKGLAYPNLAACCTRATLLARH